MLSIQTIFTLALVFLMIPASFHVASWMSGWSKLARRLPGVRPAPGAQSFGGSLAIGSPFFNYNSIVRFACDDDHLHIGLLRPLGLFSHPPISIPWALVEFIDRPDPDRFRFRRVRIRVDGLKLWIPMRALRTELAVRREMEASSVGGRAAVESA